MDLLAGLNEPQREAVLRTSGPLLIFAGAGSGKTRTLTHRTANLILHHRVPAGRILAVTFTNKAAREMRERLNQLVGTEANRIWMGTFHAMCAQMLRIHGHLIGIDPRFVIFDTDDSTRLMKEILKEVDIDSDRYPAPRMLARISDAKNNLQSPDDLQSVAGSPYHRVVARVFKTYQERLKAAHALDFDDLLSEAVRLVTESQWAREHWSERFLHVLIDEFQDVNQAQFEWAKALASKHGNICVVGDDDQCVAAGSSVLTPQGNFAIESLQSGATVVGAAGRGTTAPAEVSEVKTRHYEGPLIQATTQSGRVLRVTPNHMCFARLGVRGDVFYAYLMYRRDKGYRLGIAVAARSDGRDPDLVNGLRVRANQEGADKMWVLRVCRSRSEAAFYENLWAFEFGIPTTIFSVAGRGPLNMTQAQVDELYERIDTRTRAARLMEVLGIDAAHPHYRPSVLVAAGKDHRLVVHLTTFGGNSPSLQSPWYRHRVWLNTSDRVLEQQIIKSGLETRPGQRQTWRVERSYAELGRTALLAEQIANAAGGADVARWAALSEGLKFAYQPAAHLRPTMLVPVWQDGRIVEEEIESVESVPYCGPVHDLNVSHLHNYIVNGIVVHNSIYAWRGADVKIILDFEKQYPDAHIIRLEQNYRSTQNILDAAHGVISNNLGRKAKKLWTETESGASIVLNGAANAQEEAAWVVRQIELLQREQHLKLSDFAILCRVNAQSRPFEEAFMRSRVPLKLVGTQRFYDRKEIKDLVSYLKVLYNPNDNIALGRVINVPARGIGATTIEKLGLIARESGLSLRDVILNCGQEVLGRAINLKLEPLRRVLIALQADAEGAPTVVELLDKVLDRTNYYEFLRGDRSGNGNDRVANVEEFMSAASVFDARMQDEDFGFNDESRDPEMPVEGPPYLGLFLESSALESGTESGATTEDAAVLMTLHSAKGLEFPIVFMPGMEQGLLPHSRALWGEQAGSEQMEEERRLCYVGLTRAQQQIYLSYATQRTLHGRTESTQPSQFIDELPPQLLDRSGFARVGAPKVSSYATAWDSPTQSTLGRNGSTQNAPRSSEPPKYRVGDRVKHPAFGEGVVVNASPSGGAGEWAEVAFLSQDAGKKKLAVAFAPLEKID